MSDYRENIADVRPGVVSKSFTYFMFAFSLLVSQVGLAATMVYVQNDSDDEVEVAKLSVDGDQLSKKAWKRGEVKIPPGQRVSVLSINRTGKFNWMDPTPRFIEPGKTVIFTLQLRRKSTDELLVIKQKLLGTGSNSKLWYSIDDAAGSLDWILPFGEISGSWPKDEPAKLHYIYRALETQKDDSLELILNE